MKMTIKHWNGKTIYEAEAASTLELIHLAVKDSIVLRRADLSGANLRRADLSGANLRRADLSGAILSGANLRRSNLSGANLSGAILSGAILSGANLSGADLKDSIIETGEKWGQYLAEVVPALLTAGGHELAEVLTAKHWDCHEWGADNCPMAAAFDSPRGMEGVPILYRPRAEQFIRYFDARLIPLEAVGKK
jgi:Pentapeptide repeats (8 copies)